MNRSEKKAIRIKILSTQDDFCKTCPIHRNHARAKGSRYAESYCIKNCQIGAQLKELGNQLTNAVAEAGSINWTSEEVLYLLNHVGLYSIDHIAARLNRDPNSVFAKYAKLKLQKKESVK